MEKEILIEIINKRTVAILSHGSSIQELENKITDLSNANICWLSLGLFTIMEDFILSKINKRLDIVFDTATVPESNITEYENIRLTRLEKFLERKDNNLWVTSYGMFRDAIIPYRPNFLTQYPKKIIQVDKLFPQNNVPYYMSVPNSITLAIASAMAGGAKKIILFGLDGSKENNNINTYYKPELQNKERLDAYNNNDTVSSALIRDTLSFEREWPRIYNEYKYLFGEIPVVNCSSNSIYTVIPKISYSELEKKI